MDRQYVGIDFHRRRPVIVRKNAAGEKLGSVRVANDPLALAGGIADAGPEPEVVIEATYGWYWFVDWLQAPGATVHLANPSGLNWGTHRVKNDERDATDLIDVLRLGRLPAAWIAPPATRELRELVRYRAKLVVLRAGLKAQVHSVLAKEGVLPAARDQFGRGGNAQLDARSFVGSVALPVRQRRLHRDRPHRIAPYLPRATRPGRPCGGWVTDANVSVPQRRTWPRSMIENACAPHAAHSTCSGCSLASRRHRLPHSQTISYSCVRPVTTTVYQDPRSPSRKLAGSLPANGTCRAGRLRNRKLATTVALRHRYRPMQQSPPRRAEGVVTGGCRAS